MNDKWSRLINMKYGPDGGVYVIDWYDEQACHLNQPEKFDRTNGRVYKIGYGATKPQAKVDLEKLSSPELVKLQLHENDYFVRHARRLLQERQGEGGGIQGRLNDLIFRKDLTAAKRLRALWASHVIQGTDEPLVMEVLKDPDPYVRGWAIQLACEYGTVHGWDAVLAEFAKLAANDPSPVVRLYLASALQRLEPAKRWDILKGLVSHAEDAEDHNLPCMYWYALEPLVAVDKVKALTLASTGRVPMLREFVARRMAVGVK
jgi:hypothetical protein